MRAEGERAKGLAAASQLARRGPQKQTPLTSRQLRGKISCKLRVPSDDK